LFCNVFDGQQKEKHLLTVSKLSVFDSVEGRHSFAFTFSLIIFSLAI